MDRSRNGLLFACWALVFVALMGNAAANYFNVNALIENDRSIAHTHRVKERLESLLTNCVDTESGVRGYVITGDRLYLKPYEDAEARVADEIRVLRGLIEDNPEQRARLDTLRQLRDRHRTFISNAKNAVEAKGREAGAEIIQTGQGKVLMDEIRDRIATMLDSEDRLLAERAQLAKNRYREAIVTGLAGTLLSLAVAAIALLVVWRELGRRREAQAALKVQVERLASTRNGSASSRKRRRSTSGSPRPPAT